MSLTGNAKLAGIVGWPVGHSLSPRLHAYWIAEHKLDAAYVPLPVRREDFAPAVALLPKLGFRGLNITIPHKEAAFALAAEHDDAATATGAVNTLVFEDGRIIGRNFDVLGFVGMLRDNDIASLADKSVLVLGAGGAARAIVYALTQLKAHRITIANRTLAKAEELGNQFRSSKGIAIVPWNALDDHLRTTQLLINTTSLGMTGQPALAFDLSPLPEAAAVADIVYRPLETPLLTAARKRGLKAIDGLGMLLHQAVPAFAAWFGVEPRVTPALRAHMLAALEGE
jgi:shikimate dehydrogenase